VSDTQITDAIRAATVLEHYPQHDPGDLVNILHDLQAEFRYLPEAALRETASHLGLSPSQVFGVATFYHGFHTAPRGEHTCTVCVGTACHVRGAPRLLEQLERDTGIATGGTAADLSLSVEEVGCVGACALGPLVLMDGEYHGDMTPERLSRLVRRALAEGPAPEEEP
jgi:NADH:ubiquinone oxidoreductase subunit E